MRQPNDRDNVDLDLLGLAIDVELGERSADGEPGVVHQQVDRLGVRPRRSSTRPRAVWVGEIGRQHLDVDAALRPQFAGQPLQPVDPAGDDDEIGVGRRELASEALADPARSARDQRPLPLLRHARGR